MSEPTQGAAGLDLTDLVAVWMPPPPETELPDVACLIGDLHPIHDPAEENTLTETTGKRPTKAAGSLTTDDAIWDGSYACRVLGMHPYANGRRVLVVTDEGDDLNNVRYNVDELVPVATAAEIAVADETERRNRFVDQVRSLLTRIEAGDLPVPSRVDMHVDVFPEWGDPVAVVASAASVLGARVGEGVPGFPTFCHEVPGPVRVTYTVQGYPATTPEAGAQ